MPVNIALVGNPNCGKTTLFNYLTGSTAHVGNWPGVTVDIKEGRYRGEGGRDIRVIDLPGIYSLSPYTPEEVVSRNYIMSDKPAVVINIVDATNLERNLYLTTQVMEMDTPMVVALNMMDVVEKMHDSIDISGLEAVLGVPVVAIAAAQGKGVPQLIDKAVQVSGRKRTPSTVLLESDLGPYIEQMRILLEGAGVDQPLYNGVKLVEGDEEASGALRLAPSVLRRASNIRVDAQFQCGDCEAAVADARYRYIEKRCSPLMKKSFREEGETGTDKIDRVLTSRVWGIPCFILIMFLVFHLTFTENLFFTGVPGPGALLGQWVESFVAWFTQGVSEFLASAGVSLWLRDLVVKGVLGGVGAVVGFLPLVLILYLCVSILEDSGYMARAAFIMDRLLRKFGLSGRSFVPMMMGFGCSVPAVSATRTLVSERDRRLTIMLIPFMSCGAKLPIYALIVPAFFPEKTELVITCIYLLGIAVAILAGILLRNTAFRGDVSPFIMELPPYRLPSLKTLGLHLWDKFKGFATKVGTVITISAVVIWLLSNFGFDGGGFGMVEANSAHSVLGLLGNTLKFIFVPLGFVSGPDGWKAVVAILSGLVAREAVVSTMGQLYTSAPVDVLEDSGAAALLTAAIATTFSVPAALSFITWNLLSVPCMAAVGAISQEMNSRKWFWRTVGFHLLTAWIVSFVVYWGGIGVMTLLGS